MDSNMKLTWQAVYDFVTKHFRFVVAVCSFTAVLLICIAGYEAVVDVIPSIKGDIAHTVAMTVNNGIDAKFDAVTGKIDVQGAKLDSMGTAISGVSYLKDPGFISRLFSGSAREQHQAYDSILALIPQSVSNEFAKQGQKPAEVGVTNIVIDSVLIKVKVGNSVKFARGSLTYSADSNAYTLDLYKDTIELIDVRGEPQDNGLLISTVMAKSLLTGQIFQVQSNRNIINWPTPSLADWHPYVFGYIGPQWRFTDGKLVPSGELGVRWITLNLSQWQWQVLQGSITPQGLNAMTGLSYKF